MEKLTRQTGIKCLRLQCYGLIIEHFSFHSQSIGPTVYGGRNASKSWVDSKFYCEDCGIVYEPTEKNKLVHFSKAKVLQIPSHCFLYEFKRNVYINEILPLESKNKYKDFWNSHLIFPESNRTLSLNFSVGQKTIGIISRSFHYLENQSAPDVLKIKSEEAFLIKNPSNYPDLFHKTEEERKRRFEKISKNKSSLKYSDILSLAARKVKIKKVIIPKGAIPATNIKIMDNDFNIHSFWVPTDALVLLKS